MSDKLNQNQTNIINELNQTLRQQKERIFELKAELAKSEREIGSYRRKSDQMTKALMSAVHKADEIEYLALQKYKMEMAQLKAFHDSWVRHYNNIIKRYPLDDDLKKMDTLNDRISVLINNATDSSIAKHVGGEQIGSVQGNDIAQRDNATKLSQINNRGNSSEINNSNRAASVDNKVRADEPYLDISDKDYRDIDNNFNKEKLRLAKINKNLLDTLSSLDELDMLEPVRRIKNFIDASSQASGSSDANDSGETRSSKDYSASTMQGSVVGDRLIDNKPHNGSRDVGSNKGYMDSSDANDSVDSRSSKDYSASTIQSSVVGDRLIDNKSHSGSYIDNIASQVKGTPYPSKTVQLDYKEAQNPKDGLEDIMKELGLM